MTRSSNCIIIQVILSFNRPIIPKCHICLSPIFLFEAQSSGLNKICSKHWTLETRTPYTFLASPVARDHFFLGGGGGRRVFELTNEENGGEGSDGKREKKAIHDLAGFPLSLLFFPITPRSCSALVPIILSLRITLVSNTPR